MLRRTLIVIASLVASIPLIGAAIYTSLSLANSRHREKKQAGITGVWSITKLNKHAYSVTNTSRVELYKVRLRDRKTGEMSQYYSVVSPGESLLTYYDVDFVFYAEKKSAKLFQVAVLHSK